MKAFKRQQRMIRNRESASLSRQRRKAHLENTERRNSILETENENLRRDNQILISQVKQLQEQLDSFQTIIFQKA